MIPVGLEVELRRQDMLILNPIEAGCEPSVGPLLGDERASERAEVGEAELFERQEADEHEGIGRYRIRAWRDCGGVVEGRRSCAAGLKDLPIVPEGFEHPWTRGLERAGAVGLAACGRIGRPHHGKEHLPGEFVEGIYRESRRRIDVGGVAGADHGGRRALSLRHRRPGECGQDHRCRRDAPESAAPSCKAHAAPLQSPVLNFAELGEACAIEGSLRRSSSRYRRFRRRGRARARGASVQDRRP